MFGISIVIHSLFCKDKKKREEYSKRCEKIVTKDMIYYIFVVVNKYLRFVNNNDAYDEIRKYLLQKAEESFMKNEENDYDKWLSGAIYYVFSDGGKHE